MAEQTIDYDKLAEACKPYLNQPKVADPVPVADETDLAEGTALVDGKIIYTDPTAEKCDNAEGRALDTLPMGQGVYRGKNGTQLVNHSQESLEVISNYRRNRRQYRTRSRV